jgi:hypothetical protein
VAARQHRPTLRNTLIAINPHELDEGIERFNGAVMRFEHHLE